MFYCFFFVVLNFFCLFASFGYLYFSYFSVNEPELGAGIDPGMDFNTFPSSILDKTRQDLNPQPLDRESSPIITRPEFCPRILSFITLVSVFHFCLST